MASLAVELPNEINRVRKIQDEFKSLRKMDGVIVEPQIMMMEAELQTAIKACAEGDVIQMLRSYESLKGYSD